MRVRIHHRDRQSGSWTNTVVETDHVPEVGQLLAPAPVHVFRVVLTLRCRERRSATSCGKADERSVTRIVAP
jgi:hypothetical protein